MDTSEEIFAKACPHLVDEGEHLRLRFGRWIHEYTTEDYREDFLMKEDCKSRGNIIIEEVIRFAERVIKEDHRIPKMINSLNDEKQLFDQRVAIANDLLWRATECHRGVSQKYYLKVDKEHLVDSEKNKYYLGGSGSILMLEFVIMMVRGQPVYENDIVDRIPKTNGTVDRYFGAFNNRLEKKGFKPDCIVVETDGQRKKFWKIQYTSRPK